MTGAEAVSMTFVPYGQGRGRGLDAAELGAHGVELDRLVALGLPVVPGLTMPVSHAPSLARPDVARAAIDLLAQLSGRPFGDPAHPLLIRLLASTPAGGAGVPADLPGLGITAAAASGLDEIVGSGGAIYDVFAAVIRYVGEHGSGIPGDDFAEVEYGASSHAERAAGFLGLCATAGARLAGATTIIAVDSVPARMEVSRRMGADHVVNFKSVDPVAEIMRLTDGRGVDVAIEALGTQITFESALRVLRPGGTLSSLGVYSTDLTIPLDAFAAGLADLKIVTTLCPGGKERMRRLMAVVASGRVDLKPLVTHRFKLDQIEAAYDLFSHQRDGVLKVAITP